VNLFLDTSVLLAAAGSDAGASRQIFRLSVANEWALIVTPYVLAEVEISLSNLLPQGPLDWLQLRPMLTVRDDVVTLDRPVIFEPAKDRPILFGALAWADVLLTLDREDFGALMDQTFYGLSILRPGVFLERERAAGRLR
jgi:predicted nucleic acid-binding protein